MKFNDIENFALEFPAVRDDQAGLYMCTVRGLNGRSLGVVGRGLNIAGPRYDSLGEKYKDNLVQGFLTALVVPALCAVYFAANFCLRQERMKKQLPSKDGARSDALDIKRNNGPRSGDAYVLERQENSLKQATSQDERNVEKKNDQRKERRSSKKGADNPGLDICNDDKGSSYSMDYLKVPSTKPQNRDPSRDRTAR